MAHPVVFRYLSYSTTIAEHAVRRLRRGPAFGRAGICLFLSVQLDVTGSLLGWHQDHGLPEGKGHGKKSQGSNWKVTTKGQESKYLQILRQTGLFLSFNSK